MTCHICGGDPREPFTPARFSLLQDCVICEEPTCSECGEDDLNQAGTGTDRVCALCLAAKR